MDWRERARIRSGNE
ncbi:GpE family phage tail protein [Burkholderia pseudomallei]